MHKEQRRERRRKRGKKTEGVEEEEIAYSQGKAEGVIVEKSRRCAGAPAGGARFFTGPPFWAKFMVQ